MPGFDGTGPLGGGPMTGWGRGFCVLPLPKVGAFSPVRGYPGYPVFGRPRFGLGLRRGWGMGRGGRGRRWW